MTHLAPILADIAAIMMNIPRVRSAVAPVAANVVPQSLRTPAVHAIPRVGPGQLAPIMIDIALVCPAVPLVAANVAAVLSDIPAVVANIALLRCRGGR
ncbi:MAG TPA: hypothetical protein VKS20_00735 [Candidatus Acidoferrales bacterium]|nr:hypothetical protein [Candidatus Acidoferrales bacterium]